MNVRPDPKRPAGPPLDLPPPVPAADGLPGLLASLGEELSRPLASLRREVGAVLERSGEDLTPDQSEHLRTMSVLCGELLDITRDYLDYACLTRGASPPRFEAIALSTLAVEVDRRCRPEAEGRRVSWRCTVEGADARVTTDPGICLDVAGRLVNNALKSTPEGGSVVATFRRKGAWWTLTVADTGRGIPEKDRPRVFEPFYRVARDEEAGAEGCGMGLATCRERVDQLGGTIEIGPDSDGGTTLIVRLPVAGKVPETTSKG